MKSHTLKIDLFEGKTGDVSVTGNTVTDSKYVKKLLNIPSDEVLNVYTLEKRILFFNATGDAQSRVSLAPGKRPQTTDINIDLADVKRFQATVFTDNAGQKSTGYVRYGAFVGVNGITNLPYISDKINVSAVKSDGTQSVSASYALTDAGTSLIWRVGMDYSDTEIVGSNLQGLEVKGNFYNYYASVKGLLAAEKNITSNWTLTAANKKGATFISSLKVLDIQTNLASLTVDFLYLFSKGYLYNTTTFSAGTEVNNNQNDFFVFDYDSEFQAKIAGNWSMNLKYRMQLSNFDFLPSSEQFQVGGSSSVRGYAEGLLVGDEGFSMMNELRYDLSGVLNKK